MSNICHYFSVQQVTYDVTDNLVLTVSFIDNWALRTTYKGLFLRVVNSVPQTQHLKSSYRLKRNSYIDL